MERNKKIIIGVVFTICFSLLIGFVYISLFNKKTEQKEMKFQFEVPEILNKEQNDSKIDYYNSQLNTENISDGFLIAKENVSIKKDSLTFINDIWYKEIDLNENLKKPFKSRSNQEQIAPKKSINKHASTSGKDDLSRLLDIMESNTQYINGIEDKNSSPEIPQIKNPFPNNHSLQSIEKSSKIENDIPDPKYRNNPLKTDRNESVFFSTSKEQNAFKGTVSDIKNNDKELYKAEFYNTQLIENNGLVIIHLLEDVFFEKNYVIPKYTVLYGVAKLSPNRLFLKISPNIIKNEKRLPAPIIVYDFDGLEGVFMKNNSLSSIPIETASELTELVKESYRNSNIITGGASVPLKEASIIISSDKTLKYLNRLKVKISGGHKIWLSVKKQL
jgi:hypothetical protein